MPRHGYRPPTPQPLTPEDLEEGYNILADETKLDGLKAAGGAPEVVFVRHGESQSNYIKNIAKTERLPKLFYELLLTGFTHPFLTTFGRLQSFSWGYYNLPIIIQNTNLKREDTGEKPLEDIKLFCSVLPRTMETAMCIKYGYKRWLADHEEEGEKVSLSTEPIRSIEHISELPEKGVKFGSRTMSKDDYTKFVEFVNVFNNMPDCKISKSRPIPVDFKLDVFNESIFEAATNRGLTPEQVKVLQQGVNKSLKHYYNRNIHDDISNEKASVNAAEEEMKLPAAAAAAAATVSGSVGTVGLIKGWWAALGKGGALAITIPSISNPWVLTIMGIAVFIFLAKNGIDGNKYATSNEGVTKFISNAHKIFNKTSLNIVVTHGLYMGEILGASSHKLIEREGIRQEVARAPEQQAELVRYWLGQPPPKVKSTLKEKVGQKVGLIQKAVNPEELSWEQASQSWKKTITNLYGDLASVGEMGQLENPNLQGIHCKFTPTYLDEIKNNDGREAYVNNCVISKYLPPVRDYIKEFMEKVSVDTMEERLKTDKLAPESEQAKRERLIASNMLEQQEEAPNHPGPAQVYSARQQLPEVEDPTKQQRAEAAAAATLAMATSGVLDKSVEADTGSGGLSSGLDIERTNPGATELMGGALDGWGDSRGGRRTIKSTRDLNLAKITIEDNRAYLVKSVLVNHSIDIEQIDGCCHDPLTFWKYHQARLNMGMIDIVTENFEDAIEKKSDWWSNFEKWILNLGTNFKKGDHILAISAFLGGFATALSPILTTGIYAKGGIMATIIGCLGGNWAVVAGGAIFIALILFLIVSHSTKMRSVTAHLNPLNWVLGVLIIIKFLIDNSLKIVAKTFDKFRLKKLGTLVRYISKLIGGVARLLGFVTAIISAPMKSARSLSQRRGGGGRTIRRKKMKGNKRTKKKHIRRSMNIQKTRRRRR